MAAVVVLHDCAANIAGTSAAEFATGVGEAKLIYDGVTYFGAAAGCALGVIH